MPAMDSQKDHGDIEQTNKLTMVEKQGCHIQEKAKVLGGFKCSNDI